MQPLSRLVVRLCPFDFIIEVSEAFVFFAPDKERNILMKHYYSESKELKTILTINDFVNLKREQDLLSENPDSFVMVEQKNDNYY